MLTESQKQAFISRIRTQIFLFGRAFAPTKPQYVALYAFEMSDSTVKIGVSQQVEKRQWQVSNATGLDVLRVHQTDSMPKKFALVLESRVHGIFFERNARNEFFNITFEEAVAELDKLADEITREREKTEQLFKDECEYFEANKDDIFDKMPKRGLLIPPLDKSNPSVNPLAVEHDNSLELLAKALLENVALERERLALERDKLAIERERLAFEREQFNIENSEETKNFKKAQLLRELASAARDFYLRDSLVNYSAKLITGKNFIEGMLNTDEDCSSDLKVPPRRIK